MIYFLFFIFFTLLFFAIFNIIFSNNDSNKRINDDFEAHLVRTNKKKKRNMGYISALISNKEVQKIFGSNFDKVEKKLEQANRPFDMQKEDYIALSIFIPLLIGIIVLIVSVVFINNIFKSIGFALLGLLFAMFIIHMMLSSAIKKRKRAAIKELPDFIDLLTINLEAGLGFDLSLKRILAKKQGVLTEEFTKYLREIEIGKTRKASLENLAHRLDVEAIYMLTKSIIQADELGVSIVKVLRVQSEELRVKRKDSAEEQAMKAPIKILFPLLFFIFPVIFIVLLLPIAIQFMGQMN